MTIVGATIGNTPRAMYSDGVYLYVHNATGAFIKFSESGNQLINQGTTVFNNTNITSNSFVSIISDGTKVYFQYTYQIERYDLSGGTIERTMPYNDGSEYPTPAAEDIGMALLDSLRMWVGVSITFGSGDDVVLLLNPVRKP